jgi:tRNA(Arg) A34 adenosine deaminase TadA
METAIKMAVKARNLGEVPVGCIIIDNKKKILSRSGNSVIEESDPTAHAEINAIREACKKIKSDRLSECSIYVTLEPCIMCASAISKAKIKRLYFGADDLKYGAINGSSNFFQKKNCNHVPEIYDNIAKASCEALINNFFKSHR